MDNLVWMVLLTVFFLAMLVSGSGGLSPPPPRNFHQRSRSLERGLGCAFLRIRYRLVFLERSGKRSPVLHRLYFGKVALRRQFIFACGDFWLARDTPEVPAQDAVLRRAGRYYLAGYLHCSGYGSSGALQLGSFRFWSVPTGRRSQVTTSPGSGVFWLDGVPDLIRGLWKTVGDRFWGGGCPQASFYCRGLGYVTPGSFDFRPTPAAPAPLSDFGERQTSQGGTIQFPVSVRAFLYASPFDQPFERRRDRGNGVAVSTFAQVVAAFQERRSYFLWRLGCRRFVKNCLDRFGKAQARHLNSLWVLACHTRYKFNTFFEFLDLLPQMFQFDICVSSSSVEFRRLLFQLSKLSPQNRERSYVRIHTFHRGGTLPNAQDNCKAN